MNDRSTKPINAGDALLGALGARSERDHLSRPIRHEVHPNERGVWHLGRRLFFCSFQPIEYPSFSYFALADNLNATKHTVRRRKMRPALHRFPPQAELAAASVRPITDWRRRARARDKVDITVPMGTPTSVEISL